MLLDLPARKRFSQNVSGHIVGRAILQLDEPPLYHIMNEVVVDVDVLCAHVIIIILRELEHCLVVAIEYY